MDDGFTLEGVGDLRKAIAGATNRFPEEVDKEVLKLAYMGMREIKLLTPVDKGRLRSSLTFNAGNTNSTDFEGKSEGQIIKGKGSVEFGTNVEYAPYIEDGFNLVSHFVPGTWVNGRFKYDPNATNTGMTVSSKHVEGKHMFAKGLQNLGPKAQIELEKWVAKMLRNIEEHNNDISATFEDL